MISKSEIIQIVLFALFLFLSVGSVVLVTAAFYIPPMIIYLPYATKPVEIKSSDLAGVMALLALLSIALLLKARKTKI